MSGGLFVTFEGGEGAGKSTQVQHLAASLRAKGREVVTTREPGGAPLAEKIRAVLLAEGRAPRDPLVETLLFAAARRDHVLATIMPGLARGAIVISDRFSDSTRAYQGAGGGLSEETLELIDTLATGGLRPDLTFVLDLPPEIGLERAALRRGAGAGADAYESAAVDFHQRVRDAFRSIALREPARCRLLNAEGNPAVISAAVLAEVTRVLAEPARANNLGRIA